MADLICIKNCNNRVEAELAKGLLESSGIEAIVSADDCGGMRPHLLLGTNGTRLLVKEEEAQKALEVLEI
ncbi:DUF2007 domain-containing protein [bacterium]|nr:DUF2007 domain-containing protein [bacterium]